MLLQLPQLNLSVRRFVSQPSFQVLLQSRWSASAHAHWPCPLQIAYAPHAPQSPPQPSDPHCFPLQLFWQFLHTSRALSQPLGQLMSVYVYLHVLLWQAPADGTYFVRVAQAEGSTYGCNSTYNLRVINLGKVRDDFDGDGRTDPAKYYKVFDLYAPLFAQLTPEARGKLLKGNYERIFDQARAKVRAWEKANVK